MRQLNSYLSVKGNYQLNASGRTRHIEIQTPIIYQKVQELLPLNHLFISPTHTNALEAGAMY